MDSKAKEAGWSKFTPFLEIVSIYYFLSISELFLEIKRDGITRLHGIHVQHMPEDNPKSELHSSIQI